MKVILTEKIPSLGDIGDIVTVKPGYARNYLLPKKLALAASRSNVKEFEHQKRMLAQKKEKVRQEMLTLAEKLNKVTLRFSRKVVEEDKLYGSVSSSDIAKALEEQGFNVERRSIHLEQPIKQLGEFRVPVRVDADVVPHVRVLVDKEE